MKTNTYPYLAILFLVTLVNSLFSIYFISIFLSGIVFVLFMETLEKEYYYILFSTVITFLVIESIQGLPTFSMSLISLGLYYFIIPRIKHIFSSYLTYRFTVTFCFYAALYIVYIFFDNLSFTTWNIFLLNALFDSFVVGFII